VVTWHTGMKILVCVVFAFCFSACIPAKPGGDSLKSEKEAEIAEKTNEILDRIDTRRFFLDTYIASGHNTVVQVLMQKEDVSFLLENSGISIPLMIERIEKEEAMEYRQSLIVYFLVFQEAKCAEAIPYLIDYLNRIPENEREAVISPWHPFLYAVKAAMRITDKDIATDNIRSLFDRRVEIANDAENWYNTHKKAERK
jgi:hypothetical protein